MGWLSAIGSIFSWLGGEGIAQSLVRVAIGLGVSSLLNKKNKSAAGSTSDSSIKGTRQQISPATDNKLPVAYGESYFSGTIVDVRLTNSNKELYAVLALCEQTGPIFSTNPGTPLSRTPSSITIDDIYLSNQRVIFRSDGTTIDHTIDDTGVIDTNPSGLVGIYLYQGNSNYPMLPKITGTNTAIPGTVPPAAYSVMPGWDNTYTMDNTIFVIVKMNYDPSKGLKSIPNMKFHVRNTMNKPGDVAYDYMSNAMYGAGLDDALIDNDSLIAMNTYSDESVTLGTYPAQPRYRINGLVRTTETVLSNMEKIAATAGSNVTFDVTTGKWAVVVNKLTAKTLEFNDANILGQLNVASTNLDAYYNQVECQFPYKVLKDQFNFVRIELPGAYMSANETPNTYQLSHELTNDVVQATILANLDLRQAREDLTVTFSTDYSKYNVQIGDVVGITNAVYGWTSREFRVIRVRKNESDEGQLTVEITVQSYNPDVYTVESITDFVPLIGVGHSIPSLAPIATPEAPTVSTTTISSQPSIIIHGVIPSGVVTAFEFWYTADTNPNDDLRVYTLLGTERAANGQAFITGDTPFFKTVLLQSGDYYFKVRGVNAAGTSKFSLPSLITPYTYTQAPDVLVYTAPVVDANGQPVGAEAGGMSLAMMAAYLASKLNWFGEGGILSGNATIESVFGLGEEEANVVTSGVEASQVSVSSNGNLVTSHASSLNFTGAGQSASTIGNVTTINIPGLTANVAPGFLKATASHGGNIVLASNSDTINFVGNSGIKVYSIAGANQIVVSLDQTVVANIAAAVVANAQPPAGPESHVSTLVGQTYPAIFGSGPTHGLVDSRAGIFTHDHLVFGGTGATAQLKANNVVTAAANLTLNVSGTIQNFYNYPTLSSGNWTRKPFYDETKTDKYDYGTKLAVYYSTASYAGGNLDAQSWSSWTLLGSNDGINGFNGEIPNWVPPTYANIQSNPPPVPATITNAPYVVEEHLECDGLDSLRAFSAAESDIYANYDPFKPDILTVVETNPGFWANTVSNNLSKTTSLSSGGVAPHNGTANQLVMFGVSPFNHPTGTAFSNNTIFGHAIENYVNTYPNAISMHQIVNNGSVFVGINTSNNKVYRSSDGLEWIRVKMPSEVTTVNEWDYNPIPPFIHVIHNGSQFFAYAEGGRVATSSNGTLWVEQIATTALDANTIQVIGASAKYLAVGPLGVQTSANGIDWATPVMPPACAGLHPWSCVWDGSQYLIGGQYAGVGNALLSSPTGVTWTAVPYINNPTSATNVSIANNTQYTNAQALRGKVVASVLP